MLLNKNILNHLINAEIKTLVNSLKLIGNSDGPGASAPDLSPVILYVRKSKKKVGILKKITLRIGLEYSNQPVISEVKLVFQEPLETFNALYSHVRGF